MAAHLSALLILTGLTGIHSLTTVSKVSVKRGGSVSVPCLYESQYTAHQRIFTVTISDLSVKRSYYWCAVEIYGTDIRTLFQLSVTTGQPWLSVDRQEVTGFIGEDVTIHCHYSVGGESRWCRLGGSCVKEPSGSIEGTTVTINAKVAFVFSVTLSGLRTQNSGWYFCDKGGLQMPVHVTVKKRPRTTTLAPNTVSNTFSTTPVFHTTVLAYEEHTTVQAGSHRSVASLCYG
uniref:polymeric immunoglobulin receptor-like n=1 Tax=Semicossyphus pulcher TaxID=241346 RepID=UPI0037E7AE68